MMKKTNRILYNFMFSIPMLFGVGNVSAQSKPNPTFCMARHYYMLADTINPIFTEPLLSKWQPDKAVMRFEMDEKPMRYTPRQFTVKPSKDFKTSASNGSHVTTLKAALVDCESFDTLQQATCQLCIATKKMGNQPVLAQIIGDSYVQGEFFGEALLKRKYVPKLQLIGLCQTAEPGQYDEGRGGWTVNKYFEPSVDAETAYNGFCQPVGNCRYWGNTKFWQTSYAVEEGKEKNSLVRYSCGRFGKCLPLYDKTTGYKLNPQKGDLMFDEAKKCYVLYNGKQWKEKKAEQLSWKFDYAKYLEMWKLKTPDYLFVLLGLNDYRDSLIADYSPWNERMEEMARQFHRVNPQGKFVILMPCSTCGSMNNWRGDFTIRQNACMWKLRQNMLKTFDGREKEQIYVVDIAACIDSENGYRKNSEGVQTGNPHPYLSYPDMSVPVAAFLQYYRK